MIQPIHLPDYPAFLAELKTRILHARTFAARAVNRELILLYWDIGRGIVEKQQALGWGESVIDRLSSDLQDAFPHTAGFSPRNLRDMKRFYLAYSDESIWRQPVAKFVKAGAESPVWRQVVAKFQAGKSPNEFLRRLVAEIPWGQNIMILNKITDAVRDILLPEK